ncbi:tyrosine--tRNA ligase [Candidatus Woesebacteria bacterium]|nr:tyrosine--tRNA ligase [Candidatus Woesebacteria bacterium]
MTTDQQQLDEVLTRGVAEVLPNKESLKKLLQEKKIRLYLGIDPTGSLLTLGHSVVLRKLQRFAELGHEVILLIGNGTVRIGDPTGKDTTRPELTDEQINENFKSWKEQASKVLDFNKIEIRHNGDWLDKLTMPDVVKLMAKTTVQQLMERDMFQDRLKEGKPIHGHEIMYPLLQGYDSVAMDVDLEIGGTDQTFNMMMGRTLQKAYNNHEKWVLTTPIINGTDGRKMSKSYGNFVALTENSNDMYGKLMSTADEEIITYFEVLTDLPMSEIEEMAAKIEAGENPMQFKKKLAFIITEMYHDAQKANEAQEHFQKTVQEKEIPDDVPEVSVGQEILSLLELVQKCIPEESNSNLRRLIEQGAVELIEQGESSGKKPTDPYQTVELASVAVVRIGKRRYFKLK